MGFFSGLLIGIAGGLVIGWMFLPEPKWLREFWESRGWARRTKPTVLSGP